MVTVSVGISVVMNRHDKGWLAMISGSFPITEVTLVICELYDTEVDTKDLRILSSGQVLIETYLLSEYSF